MPTESRDASLPLVNRSAPVKTLDAEKRTVDLIFSSGATVRRARWSGWDARIPYDENLIVSDAAVNMERLNAGAPVVDSHAVYSTRSQVAVVDKAWLDGGVGMARVRFPSAGVDEAADRMWGLVSEGIVRNVSVGYSQDKVRVVEAEKKDDIEQWFIERWTPHEISFVTIPADSKAQVRSEEPRDGARMFPAVIINETRKATGMTESSAANTPEATPANIETLAAPAAAPAVAADAIRAAIEADRKRIAEITAIASRVAMPDAEVQNAINTGMALDAFRARALDLIPAPATRIASGGSAVVVTDPGRSPTETLETRVAGMVARFGGKIDERLDARAQAQAREFAGYSLLDHAREMLNLNHRASPIAVYDKLVERNMMGTTDYPNLLAAVANKILLGAYQYQTPSYQKFSKKRNFNDFRVHNFLRLGDFPLPQYITETGEFKNGTLSESKNTGSANTAGIIVTLSRQMVVNDDLNAFGDLARLAGQRMVDWENYTAWNYILTGAGTTSCGPTLGDTGALFNNTAITTAGGHANNSSTGAAISGAVGGSLDLARQAMRNQVSLDGVPINDANNPIFLVVGPQKETEAQTILSTALLATQTTNVNVFMGKFQLIVDAYIKDKSWFLYADPNGMTPVLQWGYVNGFEGPRFSLDTPFRQDGMSLKAVEDWGIAAVDFRGAYRNSGA